MEIIEWENGFELEIIPEKKLRDKRIFELGIPPDLAAGFEGIVLDYNKIIEVTVGRNNRGKWKVSNTFLHKNEWEVEEVENFISNCEIRVYPLQKNKNRKVPYVVTLNWDKKAVVLVIGRQSKKDKTIGEVIKEFEDNELTD